MVRVQQNNTPFAKGWAFTGGIVPPPATVYEALAASIGGGYTALVQPDQYVVVLDTGSVGVVNIGSFLTDYTVVV